MTVDEQNRWAEERLEQLEEGCRRDAERQRLLRALAEDVWLERQRVLELLEWSADQGD